ncbi:MAG: exodeoxyribonuclease VII large subunit [Methylothermaceae bacterium]|nr:exodeoxyribonuclease VII large subunit [Methylothermaceae bacterium]
MDRISRAIADHVPKQQWVQAEISQLKAANGGHWWLELAEHDDQANLAARARAVMWKPQAASLLERFKSATGGTLQAGLKVLVLVDTNFHPAYGLSLVVRNIDPSYTWRSVRISS